MAEYSKSRHLGRRWSRIRDPYAFWKYLRQGEGRHCVYEKGCPNRKLTEQINNERNLLGEEGGPVQHGSQSNNHAEDNGCSSGASSGDEGGESNQRPRLANPESGREKKRLAERGFQAGLKAILQKIQVVDADGIRMARARNPNDKELQEWWDRFKYSHNFEKKVALEIRDIKAEYRYLTWYSILKQTSSDVYKSQTDKVLLSVEESVEWIHNILIFNNMNVGDFVRWLWQFIDCKSGKKNTLHLFGPPNCGKTLLAKSIVLSTVMCSLMSKVGTVKDSQFVFQPILGARSCLMNEALLTDHNYEQFLNIMEGEEFPVDVKNEAPALLKRVPIIITSNAPLTSDLTQWRMACAGPAIEPRVNTFVMEPMHELKNIDKLALHPKAWLSMLIEYVGEDVLERNNSMNKE